MYVKNIISKCIGLKHSINVPLKNLEGRHPYKVAKIFHCTNVQDSERIVVIK